MARFDVPTLEWYLTQPFEVAVYINGQLRHDGMVVTCPGCQQVIDRQAIVDASGPVSYPIQGDVEDGFQHYEPGPVEITIWHAGHKPDPKGWGKKVSGPNARD
jgi:hypothetical protein